MDYDPLVKFDLKCTPLVSTFNLKDFSAYLAILAASENATWLARVALRSKELK